MLDTLGRQSRISTQPTGKYVGLTDHRRRWLKAIHDHGPLNTRMLHRFTGGTPSSQSRTTESLKDMSRETNTDHGGPYLTRPSKQNQTFNPRSNYLVYDLADAGLRALGDDLSEFRPRGRHPWRHEHMCAHITASIELSCIERGYRYIAQHELLEKGISLGNLVKYKWTKEQKEVERLLIPDALFAIDYGGTFRTFVLEADRATEAVKPSTDQQKSFRRNALQYGSFIGKGQYKRDYQMKGGLVVLHVTLSEARVQSFLKTIENDVPGCTYQMMQFAPQFADDFKSPDFLPQFADQPWQRAGMEPFDIMQA